MSLLVVFFLGGAFFFSGRGGGCSMVGWYVCCTILLQTDVCLVVEVCIFICICIHKFMPQQVEECREHCDFFSLGLGDFCYWFLLLIEFCQVIYNFLAYLTFRKLYKQLFHHEGCFFPFFFFFLCFSFVPLFFFSFIFSCKTYSSVCKIELFHFKQTYRTYTIVCA